MVQPQIENLPDFVWAKGRKKLSNDVIFSIEHIVYKLNLVDVEDRAAAFNNIGVLQAYINNFNESVDAFRISLSHNFSEGVYSNYVQTLEKTGKYELAIQECLDFLNNYPNNQRMFDLSLSIVKKYFLIDYFNKIFEFLTYHSSDEIILNKYSHTKNQYDENFKYLTKLNIDCKYLSSLVNVAYIEVKKLQIGTINISIEYNPEINHLTIIFKVDDADFEDIKLLNRNFDNEIFNLIESQTIKSELYFDHLSKVSIGFVIGSEQKRVA